MFLITDVYCLYSLKIFRNAKLAWFTLVYYMIFVKLDCYWCKMAIFVNNYWCNVKYSILGGFILS